MRIGALRHERIVEDGRGAGRQREDQGGNQGQGTVWHGIGRVDRSGECAIAVTARANHICLRRDARIGIPTPAPTLQKL
ncbi:hypothetical protein GCM10007387_56670 [Pseudoduganella albidiflava]|uniref:Uncharacterized protein n=1 Tax=Pseudoduganella albidiflava TaxID=321983 RepID=A0AA87XXY9_9BURK|nr:hypothetical protein GCM10007387_56670 [Pseudoduganella albidiflava]